MKGTREANIYFISSWKWKDLRFHIYICDYIDDSCPFVDYYFICMCQRQCHNLWHRENNILISIIQNEHQNILSTTYWIINQLINWSMINNVCRCTLMKFPCPKRFYFHPVGVQHLHCPGKCDLCRQQAAGPLAHTVPAIYSPGGS